MGQDYVRYAGIMVLDFNCNYCGCDDATDLVAALLNEMTKEPASDVPVKITPERPLPRRNHRNGRSGHGYRGPRDHRHNNYGGHRRRNRDGHSRSRRHDNHGKNHSSRHAFNIRHRED